MKNSPHLLFQSTAFPVLSGEDQETSPGVFGKDLAHWLAAQLRAAGVPAHEVFPEDFGWCIRVESKPHHLYVACSNDGVKADHWRVHVFVEGGTMARLLGHDHSAEELATTFATVRRCLEASADVHGLHEGPHA